MEAANGQMRKDDRREDEERRLCPDAHGALLVERGIVADAMRAVGRVEPLSREEVREWLADLAGAPEEAVVIIAAASLARSRMPLDEPPWDPAPLIVGPVRLGRRRSGRYVSRKSQDPWVTKPVLRSRGWTETSIRRFLPAPERFKRNPMGRYRPMPLWHPETVARIEATGEWREWLEKSLRRRDTDMRTLARREPGNAFRRRAVDEAIKGARRP